MEGEYDIFKDPSFKPAAKLAQGTSPLLNRYLRQDLQFKTDILYQGPLGGGYPSCDINQPQIQERSGGTGHACGACGGKRADTATAPGDGHQPRDARLCRARLVPTRWETAARLASTPSTISNPSWRAGCRRPVMGRATICTRTRTSVSRSSAT